MSWRHRLLRRRQHEEQLEKEVRYHLDSHINDLISQGYSLDEAQRQANLALGGAEQVKEMCRDARGTRWFEELLRDLRIALRMMRKNPGFTLVVIATLALGTGANTAIFGLVDALLLRPLPAVKAPSELVLLMRGEGQGPALSYPDFTVLREQNEVLSGLALYTQAPISFGNNVRSEVVLGGMVSANYFDVLGIKPTLGRMFLPEEDGAPGAHAVVVLNHSFWQSRFNSDPTLVGQTIVLNNRQFTVIGIGPSGFEGETPPMKISLWIPVTMMSTLRWDQQDSGTRDPLRNRNNETFGAIGRLKQNVSVSQAQAALETINRQLELSSPAPTDRRPNPSSDRSLRLITPQGIMLGPIREMAVKSSRLAVATVLTVLLIACANVANLLLARAVRRRKEFAVRLAMGATRWRLIRQLLTESVLLALAGATAGLLLAYWINQLLTAYKPPFPPPFTFALDLSFDTRVFVFTFLMAVVTGVIFGLVPALQASRPDVLPVLKNEGHAEGVGIRWLNLRNALVVTQVALSLALLISTGLFLRTLSYARQIDLGLKPDQVLEASFNLKLQGYNEAKGREFYQQIVERLKSVPGVQTASVTNLVPLGFMWLSTSVVPEGREIPLNERIFAGDVSAGSQYFETIGTPLLRGRDFTAQDTINSTPVAIVSEKLARILWPEIKEPGAALGRRLRVGRSDLITCEVIGVVKDSRNNIFNRIDREPEPTIYRPFAQNYSARASLLVRTGGDPRGLISSVQHEVAALDQNLPSQNLQPLSETVSLASWSARAGAAVLGVFGSLGLALAAIGIYGVMSYSVSRRTREIGLRLALGAKTRDVMELIVRQGMGLTLVGATIGVLLAVAATRLLASLVYGVTPTDPATFAGVVLFVLVVAVLACYLPARRATKVDPMKALRCE